MPKLDQRRGGEKKTVSVVVTNPTGADNFLVYRFSATATITDINVVCMDGTSVVLTFNKCDSNGLNAVAVCSPITATTTNTAGTIINSSVDAGDYLSYTSTANNGTVTRLIITFQFTGG